jgi:hypothetical protein
MNKEGTKRLTKTVKLSQINYQFLLPANFHQLVPGIDTTHFGNAKKLYHHTVN